MPCRDPRVLAWALALAACGAPAPGAPSVAPPSAPVLVLDRASASPTSSAVLELTTGDVRVRRAGTDVWVTARPGDALAPSDLLQTLDGRAVVRLSSDARLEVESGTTLAMPAPDQPARIRPLLGRIVATTRPSEDALELELAPGTLHLEGDARAGASAIVDIQADATDVEVVSGEARITRTGTTAIAVHAQRWVRIASDGSVRESGTSGPTVALVAPRAGETVRTQRDVTLRWAALPSAARYRVVVRGATMTRTFDADETSLTTTFAAGRFTWSVQTLGQDGLSRAEERRALVVEIDRAAPSLSLSQPVADTVTHDAIIRVSGQTEPDVLVEAGGRSTHADGRGAFLLDAPIGVGLTNLVVRVTDACGNRRAEVRSVVRE